MDSRELPSLAYVDKIENATKQVLTNVFDRLKDGVGVKGEGPNRLFFPNGIELISLIVKVNVKDGVDVEIKVAGEKGIKGVDITGRQAPEDASTSSAVSPSPALSS